MPFSHHQLLPDPILPAPLSLPAGPLSSPRSHHLSLTPTLLATFPCWSGHLHTSNSSCLEAQRSLDLLTLCLPCSFTVQVCFLCLYSLGRSVLEQKERPSCHSAPLWHDSTDGTLKKSCDHDLILSACTSFLLVDTAVLYIQGHQLLTLLALSLPHLHQYFLYVPTILPSFPVLEKRLIVGVER